MEQINQNLTIEYGITSLNKKGEELCGDKVECVSNDERLTLVLADGLGSGVKANILSTLTSKILSTMVANNIPLDECIDTIISSLPVCKVRDVAYSTFSILSVDKFSDAVLVEFDNPPAIYLKNGELIPLERKLTEYQRKKIYTSKFKLGIDDAIIIMSDGVIHAGVGETLNYGWDVNEIREFAKIHYDKSLSATAYASILANACYSLYDGKPGDDTTVLAVRGRTPLKANIMIGPPVSKERDEQVVMEFMQGDGKKIVCGGTSSQVVARVLKKELSAGFDYPDKDIPPIGYIDGIDLTCEGVITLTRMAKYAQEYASAKNPEIKIFKGKDGASLLSKLLLNDATEINFFVGRSVNLAHEGLEIDNKTKLDMISTLGDIFRSLGKKVSIAYY